MPPELGELLQRTAKAPTRPFDMPSIQARVRRRRKVRQGTGAAAALVAVAAAAVLVADLLRPEQLVGFADPPPVVEEYPLEFPVEPEPLPEPDDQEPGADDADPAEPEPEPANEIAFEEYPQPDDLPARIVGQVAGEDRLVLIDTASGAVIRTLWAEREDPLNVNERTGGNPRLLDDTLWHSSVDYDSLQLSRDRAALYVPVCCGRWSGLVYRVDLEDSVAWQEYAQGSRDGFHAEVLFGRLFSFVDGGWDLRLNWLDDPRERIDAEAFRKDVGSGVRSSLAARDTHEGLLFVVPSPDGQRYAAGFHVYHHYHRTWEWTLAVIDQDFNVERAVTGEYLFGGLESLQGQAPTWSPDGRHLAFSAPGSPGGVHVIDIETAETWADARRAANAPYRPFSHPVFDADGHLDVVVTDTRLAGADADLSPEGLTATAHLELDLSEAFIEGRAEPPSQPLPGPVRSRHIDATGRYSLFVLEDGTAFWRGPEGVQGFLDLEVTMASALW